MGYSIARELLTLPASITITAIGYKLLTEQQIEMMSIRELPAKFTKNRQKKSGLVITYRQSAMDKGEVPAVILRQWYEKSGDVTPEAFVNSSCITSLCWHCHVFNLCKTELFGKHLPMGSHTFCNRIYTNRKLSKAHITFLLGTITDEPAQLSPLMQWKYSRHPGVMTYHLIQYF